MQKLLIIFIILFSVNIFSEVQNSELEEFEIRSYSPQSSGLKDLVFELRVDGLKEILEKSLVIGKLSDLYFKVYWQYPSEFRVEVMGLPKGFKEVKDDLKQLVMGKLEFVIPGKISDKLKAYKIKVEPITDGKLLKAIDETYTLAVPEIDLTFDKQGRLKIMETKMSQGALVSEFQYSPKSWSNNKLTLDRVSSSSSANGSKLSVINEIEYASVAGFGLPLNLKVINIVEYMQAPKDQKEKPKLEKKETKSYLRFSKYEVNTGKAARFINEGLLR